MVNILGGCRHLLVCARGCGVRSMESGEKYHLVATMPFTYLVTDLPLPIHPVNI